VAVACHHHVGAQLLHIQLLLALQQEGAAQQVADRREPRHGGADRGNHHLAFATVNLPQRGQPLAHQLAVRGEMVVGQRLPIGQQGGLDIGGKPWQLGLQPLCGLGIGSQYQQGVACLGQACQYGGIQAIGQGWAAGLLTGRGNAGQCVQHSSSHSWICEYYTSGHFTPKVCLPSIYKRPSGPRPATIRTPYQ
jgi:hypothetical protein